MSKKTIDYRSITPGGPGSDDSKAGVNFRWWKEPKSDRPQAIAGVVQYIKEHMGAIETQRQIGARMYNNSSIMGVNGLSYTKMANVAPGQNQTRISYNLVASAIDTLSAKISKNKPKPMFLTSGGDYRLQRKAKKLDKFVEGVFYENHSDELAVQAFRDACIFGDGFVHVFPLNGRVKWERTLSSEIYVDLMESFYGHPRQMHRVTNMDRAVLLDMFPEYRKAILECNGANLEGEAQYQSMADLITVAESWHLPSGPEATDGLHCISINSTELFSEKWEWDFFPFARMTWKHRPYGYFGQSVAEEIQPQQLELNKLLWVVQRSMHLGGTFKIAMENSSKIVKEHLNNDIGTILTYTNNPPTYLVPPLVQPEIYAHIQTIKNSAYEQIGLSQLTATGTKPAGLDSGKALREYNDIETDRFVIVGQAYEAFSLELAKLSVWAAKCIFDSEGELKVKVPGKKFIEEIDWKDVDLEDDEYIMKLYPVSSLPNDPAGRLQTIQEYMQAGLMDPRQGRRLLDFPDLEAEETLANSVEDRIHEVLEDIIEDGEYTAPDPFMDLALAEQLLVEYYNYAVVGNVEEEKLEMLRIFKSQLDILKVKAMPPQPMMAPGGQPQAAPMPQPQSDLVPNVG